jgi:hypothetical protein
MSGRGWGWAVKAGFDVFLSYWPADSKVAAGLKDELAEIFGDDRVRNTAYDEDVSWPLTQVERVFPASAVMVVLIGRDWANLTDQRGNHLDEPANSYLRNELLQAFKLNLLVVPVCFDGAAMPDRDQLPAFLRPLAAFRPKHLRTADLDTDKRIFRRDARALAREIKAEWRLRQGLFPQWVIGLACAAAIIAAVAAGAWGSVLLDSLGLPLPPAGRLRAVEDKQQPLWQRLGAAEKERDESRGEAAALRDQLARLSQRLTAAERERDDARREVVTLHARREQLAAAGSGLQKGARSRSRSIMFRLSTTKKSFYVSC